MTATDNDDAQFAGLWMSVSEIARSRGIDKSAVSRRIKRLEQAGATVGKRREGRALLINVADFDVAIGEMGDRARELGEQTKRGGVSGSDPIYSREQARRMSYEADIKKIELARLRGELVEVAALREAANGAGEALLRAMEQVIGRAEDLASQANVPVPVARSFLKAVVRDLRQKLADTMNTLASATASTSDAALTGEEET